MTLVNLKTNSYKRAVKNKQVIEIIDRIISSFPLTYVNLERIRKEVDTVKELFWIKDNEGKYLLVNNKFASSFQLIPSQIEGKSVDKFIPAYLINFSNALDDYIRETRNVFIIEGFSFSGIPAGEDYQTIEIPISGSQGGTGAIIGVAQKTNADELGLAEIPSSLNLLKPFVNKYILLNSDNIVVDVSTEFCNTFGLNADKVKGDQFKKTLPVLVINSIESFLKSAKDYDDAKLTIPSGEFNAYFFRGKDEEKLIVVEAVKVPEEKQPVLNDNPYDLIIQTNPEPGFIYDKDNLKFLQVNDAALKLYGYRKDEFLQLDLTDLYAPEDIQTLLAPEEKLKEKVYSKSYKQKKKDGSDILVEINRASINYKDKPAYLNVVKNITEKLKLEKHSQYFSAAFNNTEDLIFITDKEGFINSANNQVTELLGYSNKSLSETSLTSLVKDEERAKINTSIFKSVSIEKLTFNTFLKKAANEFLEVKLTSAPVFGFNSEVEAYTIICSPLVKKEIIKEVIKEVPFEIEKEKKAGEHSGIRLLSGMFHDILAPINVILGFVQELTENIKQPAPELKEALEIISQNRGSLLNSMNQIVELIQIENEKIDLKFEPVKIIDIVEDLQKEIKENKILGEGELSFGKISSSLELKTDRQKFLRILILLIKLTIKLTGEKKIYISSVPFNDQNFVVCLRDKYNSTSEKFFERLNSVFSTIYKTEEVQNVPLFDFKLLKSFLNLLAGEFKVINEKDKKDIAFVFPIDLEKVKLRNETGGEIIEKESSASFEENRITEAEREPELQSGTKSLLITEQESPVDLSQLSCIYIEDQPDSQMLFSTQMKDLKEINFAVSLEQAVPIFAEKNFDFIVVDINLQGDYNGIDILKILKTIPEFENIPIIAVSAYLLPNGKETYIKAGFSDFISKPLLKSEIINSLEKILLPQGDSK